MYKTEFCHYANVAAAIVALSTSMIDSITRPFPENDEHSNSTPQRNPAKLAITFSCTLLICEKQSRKKRCEVK